MSMAATIDAPRDLAEEPSARLEHIVETGELGEFRAVSDVAACLLPLLEAIGWRGDLRDLAEALPHYADTLDIDGLRGVLSNLEIASRPVPVDLRQLDPRILPCLFVGDAGARVLLARTADGFEAFDGTKGAVSTVPARGRGTIYATRPVERDEDERRTGSRATPWFGEIARRMRGLVLQMLGVTLLSSLLALAVPLFIMAVYDWVITTRSLETLYYLAGGVALALLADVGLRRIRARILAYVGGRIDMMIGVASFQKILHLPIVMSERSPIGMQIARIRQFEAVRDFFTGPLAGVFLDGPFVIVFLTALALIAGPLVLIPLILAVLFAAAALLIVPTMRRRVAAFSEAQARRQAFLIEMLSHMRAIKTCSAEPTWSARHRELSADAALAHLGVSQVASTTQGIAQLLMTAAGIATLVFGTLEVLDGAMSVGALIAAMALTWRVLSPLQLGFLSLTRLEQVQLGLRQINALMQLRGEREPGQLGERHRRFQGAITFNRVSLRYSVKSEPALLGADFHIVPGQIVAITGGNGAGKSSILKLIAGLYESQAGTVAIDGMDIRQLDPAELRRGIAAVPQSDTLFHGTVAQNLRLAAPTASHLDLVEAARDADLLDEVQRLENGFETRLTDKLQRQLPAGFRQRLTLARAYLKRAPIFLLDEPGNHLDSLGDAALCRKLTALRGAATVLVVTHRPSHMRLADRVIHLRGGRIVLDGPPDEVLPQLAAV